MLVPKTLYNFGYLLVLNVLPSQNRYLLASSVVTKVLLYLAIIVPISSPPPPEALCENIGIYFRNLVLIRKRR